MNIMNTDKPEVIQLEKAIKEVLDKKMELLRNEDFLSAAELRDREVKLRDRLFFEQLEDLFWRAGLNAGKTKYGQNVSHLINQLEAIIKKYKAQ